MEIANHLHSMASILSFYTSWHGKLVEQWVHCNFDLYLYSALGKKKVSELQ